MSPPVSNTVWPAIASMTADFAQAIMFSFIERISIERGYDKRPSGVLVAFDWCYG